MSGSSWLVLAIVSTLIFVALHRSHDPRRRTSVDGLRPAIDFFIGRLVRLAQPRLVVLRLPTRARTVMPYCVVAADGRGTCASQRAGVKVLLEIDRDSSGRRRKPLTRFIERSGRPALLSWYLADEPSTDPSSAPSSERATELPLVNLAIRPSRRDFPGWDVRESPQRWSCSMLDDYPFRPADARVRVAARVVDAPGRARRGRARRRRIRPDPASVRRRAEPARIPEAPADGGRGALHDYAALEAGATGPHLVVRDSAGWTSSRARGRHRDAVRRRARRPLEPSTWSTAATRLTFLRPADRRPSSSWSITAPATSARWCRSPVAAGRGSRRRGSARGSDRDELATTVGPFGVKVFRLRRGGDALTALRKLTIIKTPRDRTIAPSGRLRGCCSRCSPAPAPRPRRPTTSRSRPRRTHPWRPTTRRRAHLRERRPRAP